MIRKKIICIIGVLLAAVLLICGSVMTFLGARNFNMLTDPTAKPGDTRPFWERFLDNFDWSTFDFENFNWEDFAADFPWDQLPWDSMPDDFDLSKLPWDKLNDAFPWEDLNLGNLPENFDWGNFFDNVPENFDWGKFLGEAPSDYDWGEFLENVPEGFDWGDFAENVPENFDWGGFMNSAPENFDWGNFPWNEMPENFDWSQVPWEDVPFEDLPADFPWENVPWENFADDPSVLEGIDWNKFGKDFEWGQMPWEYLIPLVAVGAVVMPWENIDPADVPPDLWEKYPNAYPGVWYHFHTFDETTNTCTVCHRPRLYIVGRSDTFEYNGMPQSSNSAVGEKYTIVKEKCGELPDELKILEQFLVYEVTYTKTLTYVKNEKHPDESGSVPNVFTVSVSVPGREVIDLLGQDVLGQLGENVTALLGKDVTDLFAIDYRPRTLTIAPRKINIRTLSGNKTYDGEPYVLEGWEYVEGSAHFVDGDTLTVLSYGEWPTELGTHPNTIEKYTITNAAGDDMKDNYEVTPTWGELTIDWDW